jgi:hypothetical protein
MKMEFIPDGAIDTPLIRIYDFDQGAVSRLHQAIEALQLGTSDHVLLHELPGMESVSDCRLTLKVGKHDVGVRREGTHFVCTLSPTGWEDVGWRVAVFRDDPQRGDWQYLVDRSEITLILSRFGGW